MKKLILLLLCIVAVSTLTAQPLTGIKTIPGDYANLTVAVDSLNAKGVGAGGVTFQVVAGQVFTLTSNIYALKITATGTAANPIVFEKSGTGANPILMITGGSGTTDAGIWLNGSDYVTFKGIDIRNAGTSTANYLEYGFSLSGTATDGCSNNILKDLTIRMVNSQTTAYGVYALSTATSTSGRNSFNTLQNINIKNSIRGIHFTGIAGFEDYGNHIQQLQIDSCGVTGSTFYGINMSYQDSCQVVGSTISNITGNSMYVLQLNYAGNFTILNDTLRNLLNGSTGTVYGIYFPNSYGLNWIKGNVIHNISSSGGGINPIFRHVGSSTNEITENTIYNITGTFTAGQIFGIIARDGTGTDYIYRNKVYNLTSAGNLGAIGTLYTSAATNVEYIFNNFVYDLKGPNTASTYMIAGYYFTGGAVKFYYNTCYFNYTSTSTTNTSAAVYVNPANGTTLDARNNILVNTTNVTTGSMAAAFWWAGTSLANLATTCNNNLLYAGTPGPKNTIFYNGTTSYQTLTNYKSIVSPRETASVTEMPPFISTVSPHNLHINPGITTQAESGGQPIATPAITTDFDHEVRFGNAGYIGTGTAPDIGADEFSVMVTDCGITSLFSSSDSVCEGLSPVKVILKNFGPFPLTTTKINWKVNNMPRPQYTWNGNLAVNGTDTVTLGNYYFFHDTANVIQAFTSMPNYAADTASWNDTLTKTNLYIKEPPEISLSASTIPICFGDTAQISGTLSGTPPWHIMLNDGTGTQTLSNIISPTFHLSVSPVVTTTYTILSITDAGGCPNTTPVAILVTLNPAPPAVITPVGSLACCAGDSVSLMATIGLNFNYVWKKDGVPIPNATSYVYAAKQPGAYTVVVTSPAGCSATSAPVNVVVHPKPVVFIGNDTNIAPGANLFLNAGLGYTSYLWSTGVTVNTVIVDSTGTGLGTKTVWVVVTDNYGCKGTDTIRVTFVNNPGIPKNLPEESFILYPNPARDQVTLIPGTALTGEILVELLSATGSLVLSRKCIVEKGFSLISIDISTLPEGFYSLRMQHKNGVGIQNLLIIRQ